MVPLPRGGRKGRRRHRQAGRKCAARKETASLWTACRRTRALKRGRPTSHRSEAEPRHDTREGADRRVTDDGFQNREFSAGSSGGRGRGRGTGASRSVRSQPVTERRDVGVLAAFLLRRYEEAWERRA
ncbi:hypothetical protein AAFF_G00034300 [Aldrovandia affinis]|uniref:Uncharacterized protein n=1 Tax=Aldrovandia affinis TaxID=143900 RepID=A0AAD7S3F3_9TELE|nr:hypothetical protein AAFF_G00034300 [Aldrovandia affinis]